MTSTHAAAPSRTNSSERRLPSVQLAAMAFSAPFGILGFLGFMPGVTEPLDFTAGLRFSGTGSHALLFHVFATSTLHNGILMLIGLVGAVSGFFEWWAKTYFFAAAVVLLFFAVYGLAVDKSSPANFMPFNAASNWLHLGLGVIMAVLGVIFVVVRNVEDTPHHG